MATCPSHFPEICLGGLQVLPKFWPVVVGSISHNLGIGFCEFKVSLFNEDFFRVSVLSLDNSVFGGEVRVCVCNFSEFKSLFVCCFSLFFVGFDVYTSSNSFCRLREYVFVRGKRGVTKGVGVTGELVLATDETCLANAENEGKIGAELFEFEFRHVSTRGFFARDSSISGELALVFLLSTVVGCNAICRSVLVFTK